MSVCRCLSIFSYLPVCPLNHLVCLSTLLVSCLPSSPICFPHDVQKKGHNFTVELLALRLLTGSEDAHHCLCLQFVYKADLMLLFVIVGKDRRRVGLPPCL